jgi:hypothetical protein
LLKLRRDEFGTLGVDKVGNLEDIDVDSRKAEGFGSIQSLLMTS